MVVFPALVLVRLTAMPGLEIGNNLLYLETPKRSSFDLFTQPLPSVLLQLSFTLQMGWAPTKFCRWCSTLPLARVGRRMAVWISMISESPALTGLQRPTGAKETFLSERGSLVLTYLSDCWGTFQLCRIVTCSADRNAYVWVKQDDGTWKHTLVLLRFIWNIATGETSQAITTFHFFDSLNFFNFYH